MPAPIGLTPYVERWVNPVARPVFGLGRRMGSRRFAELEHVGRRSGAVRHTPLLAFRDGEAVTVALTYGPRVQWLANIRAAGHSRMRLGGQVLDLGAPRMLDEQEGLARMPRPTRFLLRRAVKCRDFVELPVLAEHPDRRSG